MCAYEVKNKQRIIDTVTLLLFLSNEFVYIMLQNTVMISIVGNHTISINSFWISFYYYVDLLTCISTECGQQLNNIGNTIMKTHWRKNISISVKHHISYKNYFIWILLQPMLVDFTQCFIKHVFLIKHKRAEAKNVCLMIIKHKLLHCLR